MSVSVIQISEQTFRAIANGTLQLRTIEAIAVAGGLTIPIVPTGSGDISKFWEPPLAYADWEMQGTQLAQGSNLESNLINSLFSDRIAAADDDIPDGSNDRRGWWGDTGEAYPIGSRYWLFERGKLTPDLPKACEDYTYEATQWMIDDGVVASVTAQAAIMLPSLLAVQIVLLRQDGTNIARNYAWVWQGVN